jgi:hypothetical protein
VFGIKPLQQCFGSMEGEDVPALRSWIELICELRFHASRFIRKWQGFPPFRINIQQIPAVFAGLLLYTGERMTFRFRSDSADRFAVDKKQIIDFVASLEQTFANRDSSRR